MNWGRVKTIFIILFLISDLFLLSILVRSEWKQGTISPEVVNSTVQVLANNGITLNPDAVPKKMSNVPYAEAENVIAGYDEFAKKLLGEDAVNTQGDTYENATGLVSFAGNSFSFSSKQGPLGESTGEKDAELIAVEFLSGLGFNLKNSQSHITQSENGYSITFINTINDMPIFNNSATIEISGKSVVKAFGIWFNLLDISGPESSLRSVTSVLIDSIPYFDLSSGEVTISGLSLGYTIPESNTYHKSAVLFPVWEIRDNSGRVYHRDARNP